MNQYFTKLEKESSSFISNKDLTWENLADFPSSVLSNLFAVNPELCDSNVDKKLKMTSNNLFDDNEEDPNNATSTTTSSSSTPTSSPRKISRITDDKTMKKNQMKKKLKKL
ncbi:unnamed protein product [Lepeophtheirus salmonis]|uniref:(salmon louse) hypothetical protein n=1 Tax=Lepeophtheirus salmonis TaxID=72036 RepID=A0A7R8CLX5_LEPSM|nr:unnamed protein product [Lepeophtheirus salmonis]CAF2861508.1 unnamed protein product [Lepeophtheirus salmonis]